MNAVRPLTDRLSSSGCRRDLHHLHPRPLPGFSPAPHARTHAVQPPVDARTHHGFAATEGHDVHEDLRRRPAVPHDRPVAEGILRAIRRHRRSGRHHRPTDGQEPRLWLREYLPCLFLCLFTISCSFSAYTHSAFSQIRFSRSFIVYRHGGAPVLRYVTLRYVEHTCVYVQRR